MDRLLVVSNRLPISINKDSKNEWKFIMSSGGLVSALSGLKKLLSFTWYILCQRSLFDRIGWPGIEIEENQQSVVSDTLINNYSCLPVFINDSVAELYYNGFSNG